MSVLTLSPKLSEIFRKLGYKPYKELADLDKNVVNHERIFPHEYWWRKLDTGLWDPIGPFEAG